MTYYPATKADEGAQERPPALMCDRCGRLVDLTEVNINEVRATWRTTNSNGKKRHRCPECLTLAEGGPHEP